jgi:hypothetical protein
MSIKRNIPYGQDSQSEPSPAHEPPLLHFPGKGGADVAAKKSAKKKKVTVAKKKASSKKR